MDIRRLAMNNNWRVVRAFQKILFDLSIGLETLNIILNLFDLTVSNISKPELTSPILKGLFSTNAKLSNSQKRKPSNKC